MEINILCCEDSPEGIFTAIYEAYEKKLKPDETRIQLNSCYELTLFANYMTSVSDKTKTEKVVRTLRREFGEEVYYMLWQAIASYHEDKGDALYHAIAVGLKMKNKSRFMENLGEKAICRVFELSRNVNNEYLHLRGFTRFKELENKILFAEIGPKNNVITFLAAHFEERLPQENFVIYDSTRNIVVIHPKGRPFVVTGADYLDPAVYTNYSSEELLYQELFRHFCKKIAIEERKNENLQRQMLPLRFRDYMVEF